MEIETEPTFQQVMWVIRDFWELPQEKEFFLDSPEFHYSSDRYCMRVYPNRNGDKTAFHVPRLSENSPEREVSFKIGLRTRKSSGDECYIYYSVSLQENRSYPRSWIEENKDEYVPDGSLTIVCTMSLSEESRTGSSAQREEEQGGFPGYSASFLSLRSPVKMELSTQSPCTLVQVIVRDVFELLRETGNSLSSPEFRFAGDTYCLQFQSNRDMGDTNLQLVRLTSNFTENTVYYRVGYWLGVCPTYSDNSRPLVGNVGLCVSCSKLEKERDKYLKFSRHLYLVFFLRLGEQSIAVAGTSDSAQKPNGLTGIHKLQSDFRQILQKGTESDACFVVRGKEFPVHRVVLRARSTVFEAMFDHDTAEKKSGRVIVDDLDPDTFGYFLEYLYTGDIQKGLSDDNAYELYVAADKYDVSTLKLECVEYMRRTLSVDSFCDVVTLALRHSEEELLQHSIRFLRDNFQRIIITAKWQQFNIYNGATANELFNKAFLPGTR